MYTILKFMFSQLGIELTFSIKQLKATLDNSSFHGSFQRQRDFCNLLDPGKHLTVSLAPQEEPELLPVQSPYCFICLVVIKEQGMEGKQSQTYPTTNEFYIRRYAGRYKYYHLMVLLWEGGSGDKSSSPMKARKQNDCASCFPPFTILFQLGLCL